MKITEKYPFLGSSVNPEKVSLTIKSAAVWLIPLLIYIGKVNEAEITKAQLTEIINLIAMLTAGAMTLYGTVRKIANKFFDIH